VVEITLADRVAQPCLGCLHHRTAPLLNGRDHARGVSSTKPQHRIDLHGDSIARHRLLCVEFDRNGAYVYLDCSLD
jgi:hypothetical protein